jgi:hypothetical protein
MKKILISFIITFCFISSNSQSYYGQSWLMGYMGIYTKYTNNNYTFDSTLVSYNTLTPFVHGKSNICDSNGNVRLISDGFNIYDRNGFVIENGDTLVDKYHYGLTSGSSYLTQSSIFLPMDSGKCYFINPDVTPYMIDSIWSKISVLKKAPFDQLLYNEIDMYANNGKGKVTKRMQKLLDSVEISKTQMMACRHGNSKDWWLLKMAQDSNDVYTFLVTQDSIYNKGKQKMPFSLVSHYDNIGQMMFNTEGDKMITGKNDFESEFFMADFDRCYGTLSNYEKIKVPIQNSAFGLDSSLFGLCYSPNGKFIYVSKYDHLLQYDVQDKTWFYIGFRDTTDAVFQGYGNMYVAPDGKLYIGNWHGFSKQMSVIENPNAKGIACNFCKRCFRSPKIIDGILTDPPCMPNYSLGAKTCYPQSNEELVMKNEELVVYPNPASTKIVVRCRMSDVSKQLYNSIGQLVLSTKENEIDVRNLNSGMYYLKVGNQTKKVVVE